MRSKNRTIIAITDGDNNIPHNIYFANIVRMKGIKQSVYCEVDETCPQNIRRLLCSSFDGVVTSREVSRMKDVKLISVEESNSIVEQDDHMIGCIEHTIDPHARSNIYFRENNIMRMKNQKRHVRKRQIIEVISRLYGRQLEDIREEHMNYYHLNPATQYRPYKLLPMFYDIDEYDYMEPIKRLSKYYEDDNYYKKILREVEAMDGMDDGVNARNCYKRLDSHINMIPHTADQIMLEYIKCRPNLFIITVWKPGINGVDRFIEYLEKYGNIYYVKRLFFSKTELRNLLFWMHDDIVFSARLTTIDRMMRSIETEETNNEVCFIFFDNIKSMPLAGHGDSSSFKNDLRNKMIELVNSNTLKYDGEDVIHINDFFYQSVEYGQMILNQNSLNVLKHQHCERIARHEKGNLIFQTFRKFMYMNLSLLEINRLMLMDTSPQYGVGEIDRVKAMIYADRNNTSKRVTHLIEKHFIENKTRFYFGDIMIRDSKLQRESQNERNNKMVDFFEAGKLQNIILDPRFYSYFQGFKVFTIDLSIYNKIIKNKITDHIDMVMTHLIDPLLLNRWIEFDENDNNCMFIRYLEKFKTLNRMPTPYEGDLYEILNKRYPHDTSMIRRSKLIKKMIAYHKTKRNVA